MQVLVTSGAGYIGSHTVVELINAGHQVIIAASILESVWPHLLRLASYLRQINPCCLQY